MSAHIGISRFDHTSPFVSRLGMFDGTCQNCPVGNVSGAYLAGMVIAVNVGQLAAKRNRDRRGNRDVAVPSWRNGDCESSVVAIIGLRIVGPCIGAGKHLVHRVVSDAATIWNTVEICTLAAFGKIRFRSRQLNVGADIRRTGRCDGISRTCACTRTTVCVPASRIWRTIRVARARLSRANALTTGNRDANVVALFTNIRLRRRAVGHALIAAVV